MATHTYPVTGEIDGSMYIARMFLKTQEEFVFKILSSIFQPFPYMLKRILHFQVECKTYFTFSVNQ